MTNQSRQPGPPSDGDSRGAASPAEKQIGRLPPKSSPRALMFARFSTAPKPPKATKFWSRRTPFPTRTFGNVQYPDCTRAKQAIAAMRMERLEVRRTPSIADEEVVRVWRQMIQELYHRSDGGAFETDALDQWRRPDRTFRDAQGRPLTIDAYLRVNHLDQDELRRALWTAGAHGIAVGLALPAAFRTIDPPAPWDIPEGQAPVGDWLPNSWGGHSMWARDYNEDGIWLVHTWGQPDQLITWRAAAIYLDEAHIVIDSVDFWRKKKPSARKFLDLAGVVAAVNRVSSYKIPEAPAGGGRAPGRMGRAGVRARRKAATR